MKQMTASSTAWLSVTALVNERWSARVSDQPWESGAGAPEELLCSDTISIRPHQLADPEFDAATFVLDSALLHTEQYCRQQRVNIHGFRSVEVLRFAQPVNGTLSFLFLLQPEATA